MVYDDLRQLMRAQNIAENPPSSPAQRQVGFDLATLQRMVEHQHLLLQTLLMLLLEKKVIEDQEFKDWMAYVDGLDGRRDGRVEARKKPILCPGCRRVNGHGSPKCQYCGHIFEVEFLARQKPE